MEVLTKVTQNHTTFKCHNCNEKGHYARNCPKKNRQENANVTTEGHEYFCPEFALQTDDRNTNMNDWWIDSGASQHMTQDRDDLINFKEFSSPVAINLADNSAIYAHGSGDAQLIVIDGNISRNIVLNNVLYVPDIKKKLVSIPAIIKKGIDVSFVNNNCIFKVNGNSYNIGKLNNGDKLYKLNLSNESCYVMSNDVELWHLRYGHLSHDNILKLHKNELVKGMDIKSKSYSPKSPCDGCLLGKQHRQPFPKKSNSNSAKPLELIHSDVCGPMKINSLGGSRYFITFIDDHSRFHSKSKSEALEKFKIFRNLVENQFGYKIKKIRTDNGG